MTNTDAVRDAFETNAHTGYIGYGLSMTDGYYAPEPKSATVRTLRQNVPITPEFFRYNTDFRPDAARCDEYNATFYVGTDYRPDHLDVAVQWEAGWKTYEVTGTRHAYYMIRKMAQKDGFHSARVNVPMITDTGYLRPNVIDLDSDDIDENDHHGLLDRGNAYYDLDN